MNSEARLSTTEAISMIVGNSIGTGIIAVPFLARKNSIPSILILALIAYCVNVILHLIIAELSYNNGGLQLVKSFESELFDKDSKHIFKHISSWFIFIAYGLAIMLGIAGNIDGGAQILVNWFNIDYQIAQVIYYIVVGAVVFMGMKAVGIAQKVACFGLVLIVAVMTISTFTLKTYSIHSAPFHLNNFLALYSMLIFATSANQAVIQCVKGLDGNVKKIRLSIFVGFAISTAFVLLVTFTVLIGVNSSIDKEMAYMELGQRIGPWAFILAGIFSLFALLTTFWSQTLALRDVVHEQTTLGYKLSWLIATLPCIIFALFKFGGFILLTRLMSGVVVLLSVMLILTYGKSRKRLGHSHICGIIGTMPFRIIMVLSTVLSAIGAVIKLS